MSQPETVIHNIGYRQYQGTRLGRGAGVQALYSQTAFSAYGIGRGLIAKLFPWLLVSGTMLPAFIIFAVMNQTGRPVMELAIYNTMVQVVPTLFIAVAAPHAISRDLRFGLMPLYFSRPITYVDYVRARFAGTWTALFLLLAAPLLVLYLGELSIKLPFGGSTVSLMAGLSGAALLALLLSGIGLLIASVTPRRGLGVAAIVAVVFGSYGMVSMMQGLLMSSGDNGAARLIAMFSPVSLVDGVQSFWFGTSQALALGELEVFEGLVLTIVAAGFVAVGYFGLMARMRKVSQR